MPGSASMIAKPVLVAELLRDLDGYENDFSLLESRGCHLEPNYGGVWHRKSEYFDLSCESSYA
ncbi:MAG: hypothetical protein OXC26_11905 [Albidovulum sp.]|nr:hypothetical protein [Albidovulum sp.]